MSKIEIQWPTVALAAVVAVALLVAYLAGPALGVPEESHLMLVTGIGALGALLLAAARQMFGLAPSAEDEDEDEDEEGGSGSAAVMLVALVLGASTLLPACSGPPRAVQLLPQEVAAALDFADEMLANRIRAVGPEMRQVVRAEVANRTILGATPEETVELGLARFEELMAGYTVARATLRVARHGTLSLEAVIQAWSASIADQDAFMTTAACTASALAEVAAALGDADVELPQPIRSAISFIGPYASGMCEVPS